MNTVNLTWEEITSRAFRCARKIRDHLIENCRDNGLVIAYAIPNGGIFAAQAIQRECLRLKHPILIELAEDIDDFRGVDLFIDDVIDSGKTRQEHLLRRRLPFFALYDKIDNASDRGVWLSFPWERMQKTEGPEDNIRRVLQFIGEDPKREGLAETPSRVVRSFSELYGGYKIDPASVLTVFEDGSCDEMVILRDCEFYSTCEHHLQPFEGVAHIGYLPDKKVIGVSKLARIVDIFARRLQIQERLTSQIADAIVKHLAPRGVGVVLEARHFCMICRGVQKQRAQMVTSALRDAFREPAARAEFFSFIKG